MATMPQWQSKFKNGLMMKLNMKTKNKPVFRAVRGKKLVTV